jgi:hypothetical protein
MKYTVVYDFITPKNGGNMTTYHDVLEAFQAYKADRSSEHWAQLWDVVLRRMEALVKTRARHLENPLQSDELHDLIIDSAVSVIIKLLSAEEVTEDFISVTFFYKNLSEFSKFKKDKRRWEKLERAASLMNSIDHLSETESVMPIIVKHQRSDRQRSASRENIKKRKVKKAPRT